MRIVAPIAAVVALIVTASASYVVMQFFASGPIVEGAAIVIGAIAAIAVKNRLWRGREAS